MTVLISLTFSGTDSGPFDLYQDSDGYTVPFATAVDKAALTLGIEYELDDITTTIKIVSDGICENFVSVPLVLPCFKFLPTNSNWMLNYLEPAAGDGVYYYGNFTGYTYGSSDFTSVRLIKLNPNLTLDQTWLATTGLNQVYYAGSTITEQPDGKIIATGTFTTYKGESARQIVRINTDGSRDETFVIGTAFDSQYYTQEAKLDSLNRIVVTGLFSSYQWVSANRIIRLLPNGDRDTSFVMGSGFNNATNGLLINDDDSMFVCGYFSSYNGVATSGGFVKLLSNGTRDMTFNSGSGFSPAGNNNPQYMCRVPGETSFYVSGAFTSYKGIPEGHIIKLNIDGTKDTSFNAGIGFNTTSIHWITKIVWGDKIMVQGSFTMYNGTPTVYAAVLNPDGTLFWANMPVDGIQYYDVFTIGNKIYGSQQGLCLKELYEYVPPITTTTTTTTLLSAPSFTNIQNTEQFSCNPFILSDCCYPENIPFSTIAISSIQTMLNGYFGASVFSPTDLEYINIVAIETVSGLILEQNNLPLELGINYTNGTTAFILGNINKTLTVPTCTNISIAIDFTIKLYGYQETTAVAKRILKYEFINCDCATTTTTTTI